ncbi:hypothetical protein QYR09_07740 [Cellulophaga lytica]|nr:hypothetical protein QYR09_07740 [Cellulophaga lytica]
MYLVNKVILALVLCVCATTSWCQKTNSNNLEIGVLAAGDEALYYGGYSKYTTPLSQNKHHFTLAFSIVAYFDFKGESEPNATLKNDIDMRLLPTINFGYSLNFNSVQINFEVPVGASIAITKGTLLNKKIGFKKTYSNTETFFNYGLSFSPKYKLNSYNSIGIYSFIPLVSDKAQSGYQIGIGWTKNISVKN